MTKLAWAFPRSEWYWSEGKAFPSFIYFNFQLYEAIRKGVPLAKLSEITYVKEFSLQQMKELVDLEEEMLKNPGRVPEDKLLIQAKKDGFSDKYLSKILKVAEKDIRKRRNELGIKEAWLRVPVSGVENACYYYSTYNAEKDTSVATDNKKKIMILGGGPNRIGQGIEFDYCCCHGRKSLRALLIEFSSENSRNFIPSKNLIP